MNLDFLYQDYQERLSRFRSQGKRLVHYTNFEAFRSIVKSESLWLRNARDMSDVYELDYGQSLIQRWAAEREAVIARLSEATCLNLSALLSFENKVYWSRVFDNIYLTSLGEFDPLRDANGRADMWGRYAKEDGIALVISPNFLAYDDHAHGLVSLPVRYWTYYDLRSFLDSIAGYLEIEAGSVSSSELRDELPYQLALLVISIKRPEYRVENEWRLVSSNVLEGKSPFITYHEEPRRHVADFSNKSASKYRLNTTLERVIVGPGPNQTSLFQRAKDVMHSANLDAAVIKSDLHQRS